MLVLPNRVERWSAERKEGRTNERKRSSDQRRRRRSSWNRPALLTDRAQDPISICDLSRPPPIANQLINSWNPRHTPPHPHTSSRYISFTASASSLFRRRRRRLVVFLLHRRRSPASEMEASSSTALYPQRRCKNIYLVRHAQGIHNVEGEKDHSAYMSPALLDAHITPLGWSQVDCLREHVTKCGLLKKIELVVVSPLMRTMQTAVGVFGGGNCNDGASASPLMVQGAGHSGRQAISSLDCPPFLAVEACRERLGVHPCDKRSSITKYRTLFPAIDFSLIENDEDVLWETDVREAIDTVAARGMKFLDWLWTREENEIAIVTHSSFLDFTLDMYGKECHPAIAKEMSKRFANCELRSMVLVDRSKLGSDTPTCDFPGKIPAGLDLPSDVADKKHIEEASNGNRGAHGCLEHSSMSSPPHFYLTT